MSADFFSLLAKTTRGSVDECFHFGMIAVSDAKGTLHYAAGKTDTYYYPRSSLKFIQALDFVNSGAYKHFGFDRQTLALSCASHDAEPFHTDKITGWLSTLGINPEELACGAAYPNNYFEKVRFYENRKTPEKIHHECSGKHCGFLSTCRFMDYQTAGYQLPEHPVQQKLAQNLSRLTDTDPHQIKWGIDGCCLPSPAIPLKSMAKAMARFTDDAVTNEFHHTFAEITEAVTRHPEFVSGSQHVDCAIMQCLKGKILLKSGADGSYAVALPKQKLGIAIKIADGNKRALPSVLVSLLQKLGVITDSEYQNVTAVIPRTIYNSQNDIVGEIQTVL